MIAVGALAEYVRIPIAFDVESILDMVADQGGSGFRLVERAIRTANVKDYDALESPLQWPSRFDTSTWCLLIAYLDGQRVGGAAVAYDTPELDALEGRSDLAALRDIRVLPATRRQGVGAALFGAAEDWATARGCRQLRVETQNINVAACRFYAMCCCVLRTVRRGAYPECPNEIQLLWYKDLVQ